MAKLLTIIALAFGSVGIAILWASGVEFPFYPPPGIVILLAGAVFLAMSKKWWTPGVGAFMGLFVVVGFLISPTGIPNLMGDNGTGPMIGTAIQVIGTATALVAGSIALRQSYRERQVAARQ